MPQTDDLRKGNEFVTSSNACLPLPCFLRVGNAGLSKEGISNTVDWMYHPCMLRVTHKVSTALAAKRHNVWCSQLLSFWLQHHIICQKKGSDVMAIGLMCKQRIQDYKLSVIYYCHVDVS